MIKNKRKRTLSSCFKQAKIICRIVRMTYQSTKLVIVLLPSSNNVKFSFQ